MILTALLPYADLYGNRGKGKLAKEYKKELCLQRTEGLVEVAEQSQNNRLTSQETFEITLSYFFIFQMMKLRDREVKQFAQS